MKKTIWMIVIALFAAIVFWCIGAYNSLVTAEENVENAWSQVENEYQRRADLVPQLVATVKGYAAHEQSTFDAVVAARAKATQMTLDPTTATPEQLLAWQTAQGELTQAMGRLLALQEAYPDLKANQNFLQLQSQLEGNENRCTTARRIFNDQAAAFNKLVRRFPTNLIANMGGFERKPYFEAEPESHVAPVVEF